MKQKLLYMWNDFVTIKDLSLAIILSIVGTLAGFFLAGTNPTRQLFFGLIGAIIAFVINTFIIKPKRTIKSQEASNKGE